MTLLRRIFSVPPLTTKPGATIVGAGAAGAAVGAAPTGAAAGFFVGGAAGAAVAALFDAAALRSVDLLRTYSSSDESVDDS